MLIFLFLLGRHFISWFLSPFWILEECDNGVLPGFLDCSAGVFTGNGCWCWILGIVGGVKVGAERLFDLLGRMSEGKGRLQ